MKIQYKNVCSIRQAEVEFPLGKMVSIRGESNQGKSALFYSVVDGFTNSPMFKKWLNNQALKDDPKAYEWIGIFDDEGNQFQVEAGTNYLYYRTNQAKYEKVGRKNIFELMDGQIPGLLYDPEDSRQIMNFQGEDDGLFPIDRSDKQIFKTYERLLSLSNTSEVLHTIKMDAEDIDVKITNALATIQQYTENSAKIDSVLDKCDIEDIEKAIDRLESLETLYNNACLDYSTIKKVSDYIKAFSCRSETLIEQFNVKDFQIKLEELRTALSLIKYIDTSKKTFNKEQFDLQTTIAIAQDYSVALTIVKQIDEDKKALDTDKDELTKILNILNEIKVCPLCGKPMGECND